MGGEGGEGNLDQQPLFPGHTLIGPFCSASSNLNIPHIRAWIPVSSNDNICLYLKSKWWLGGKRKNQSRDGEQKTAESQKTKEESHLLIRECSVVPNATESLHGLIR